MHKREGFTAIELVVVIVVIGILLSIGIIGYRSTQIAARDREREADVMAIAAYLEATYSQEYKSGSTTIKSIGTYPQREILYDTAGTNFNIVFGDLARSAKFAPGHGSNIALMTNSNAYTQTGINTGNVTPYSSSSDPYARYIYVPLRGVGGRSCVTMADSCRAFQIYYMLEGKSGYQVLESKRK